MLAQVGTVHVDLHHVTSRGDQDGAAVTAAAHLDPQPHPDHEQPLFDIPQPARADVQEDAGHAVWWRQTSAPGPATRGTIWSAGPLPGTWWAISNDTPRRQTLIRRSFEGYSRVASVPEDWPALVARAVRWAEENADRLCTATAPDAWRVPIVHSDECRPIVEAEPERVRAIPLHWVVASLHVPPQAPASWPQPRRRVILCPYLLDEAGLGD